MTNRRNTRTPKTETETEAPEKTQAELDAIEAAKATEGEAPEAEATETSEGEEDKPKSTRTKQNHDGDKVNAMTYVKLYLAEYRENERATWATFAARIKEELGYTVPPKVLSSRASSYRLQYNKTKGKAGIDLPKFKGLSDSGGRGASIDWASLQGLASEAS